MKENWDEANGVKADWLPPFTEWDFRTIQEPESRLACCWEYAGNAGAIDNNLTQWLQGAGGITAPGEYNWMMI